MEYTPQKIVEMSGYSEHGIQSAYFATVKRALNFGVADAVRWAGLDEPAFSRAMLRVTPAYFDLIFAIPNGGSRGDSQLTRGINGGKLRAEGVRPGVADVFVAVPRGEFAGLWLEFKRPGKVLSVAQSGFEHSVCQVGYGFTMVTSWNSAFFVTLGYLTHGGNGYD